MRGGGCEWGQVWVSWGNGWPLWVRQGGWVSEAGPILVGQQGGLLLRAVISSDPTNQPTNPQSFLILFLYTSPPRPHPSPLSVSFSHALRNFHLFRISLPLHFSLFRCFTLMYCISFSSTSFFSLTSFSLSPSLQFSLSLSSLHCIDPLSFVHFVRTKKSWLKWLQQSSSKEWRLNRGQ